LTVSVVVVSYRPGDWLDACLASLTSQADEVVLVDNGSAGAKASEIGRISGARVVRFETNTGFAPAAGAGAEASSGDVLAFLNDDAVAGPGWLAGAEKGLSDPSVAAVGPKVVLSTRYREISYPDEDWSAPGDPRALGRQIRSVKVNGSELLETASGPGLFRLEVDGLGDKWRWTSGRRPWYVPVPNGDSQAEVLVNGEPAPPGQVVRLINSAGAFLDTRGYGGDIGADSLDDGSFDTPAETFAISGSAFVTRRSTWLEVGPFAARYFAYYEDLDWCWRARLAGKQLLYDPNGVVEHRRSASSGGEHQPWVRVMSERNRTLTMVRNGPRGVVARALRDRFKEGPDGGVRSGIARLLPWALASRSNLARRWAVRPEAVWERWAGQSAAEP
jgi:GT2 family glycosyltransferase